MNSLNDTPHSPVETGPLAGVPYQLRCCDQIEPLAIDESIRFSWKLQPLETECGDLCQLKYRIVVARTTNARLELSNIIWDSGVIEGEDCLGIAYNGPELVSFEQLYWQVAVISTIAPNSWFWSEVQSFSMGVLNPKLWGPWLGFPYLSNPNVPCFRINFNTPQNLKRARCYITARGVYEMFLDGHRAHEDFFGNGWTDYRQRIYYRCYDVTKWLEGTETHTLGIRLAEGWYKGPIGYQCVSSHYGHQTMLQVLMVLEDDHGQRTMFHGENSGWKCKFGSIQRTGFLHGEHVDVAEENHGWMTSDFCDRDWLSPLRFVDGTSILDQARHRQVNHHPIIQAHPGPPIKVLAEISPLTVWQTYAGTYVFDLGQNIAGWVRIHLKGKPGQTVRLRFGERLNLDRSLFVENLRSAQSTDTYIIRDDKEQVWEPSFTYHGFQYVEVTGLDQPELHSLVGIAISSDTKMTGSFSCSHEGINKIFENTLWTQRANFIDIPTDCPQRDERLGWTGDALAFIKTACYNSDIKRFMNKWLIDLEDTQNFDGSVANTAPRGNAFNDGDTAYKADAAWADAMIGVPWELYRTYGDEELLKVHYTAIMKHLQYYQSTSKHGIRAHLSTFGDWLNDGDPTPNELIQTAYYAYSLDLGVKISQCLKRESEAQFLEKELIKVKAAYQKYYIKNDGKVLGDSQTAYLLTLSFDLCPKNMIPLCVEHLVSKIKARAYRLSTGFIGTHLILPCLSRFGQSDVAYRLLLQEAYPSWLYPIRCGATSIWERWNGWSPDSGPGDSNMNSYAHYAFGAVVQWFYSNILGIQALEPGYKAVVISPDFQGCPLSWARGSFESPQGRIESQWSRQDGLGRLEVLIPPNTRAEVRLNRIAKGDLKAHGLNGTKATPERLEADDSVTFRCKSGRYVFNWQYSIPLEHSGLKAKDFQAFSSSLIMR